VSPNKKSQAAGRALAQVLDLIARLRAPDGCPWDQEQTLESTAHYLLEETYEALDAIESGDVAEACAELGDVVFQVAFLAHIYQEQGRFGLAQSLQTAYEKMVRRHPHVFGKAKLKDAAAVLEQWGQIKRAERKKKGGALMDSVPKSSPALIRAQRLGYKAGRVGFDWQEADQVWDKILEEMEEVKQAANQEELQDELGDVLFAWAQWARHRGLDAETALRQASSRFQIRFGAMEELAAKRGRQLEDLDDAALDRLWEEVKAQKT
jgi:MazG family protein